MLWIPIRSDRHRFGGSGFVSISAKCKAKLNSFPENVKTVQKLKIMKPMTLTRKIKQGSGSRRSDKKNSRENIREPNSQHNGGGAGGGCKMEVGSRSVSKQTLPINNTGSNRSKKRPLKDKRKFASAQICSKLSWLGGGGGAN